MRIDDTDTKRNLPDAEGKIFRDLEWLGISHSQVEHQSKRTELYAQVVDGLKKSGSVYPCFCTPAELEEERAALLKMGKPPRYSGRCSHLSTDEIEKKIASGEKFTYRLKIPTGRGSVKWDDLIRGPLAMDADHFGDFVLTRDDGSVTYNLASIVDDVDLNVTHVVRGEDHVSNTPRQILIAEAVAKIPGIKNSLQRDVNTIRFGHIPLLLAHDKTKLSKRNGAKTVSEYKAEGILPVALQNALALVSWNPPEGKEILTTAELVDVFAVEKMSTHPSVFAEEKLHWINGEHLKRITDSTGSSTRWELAQPFLGSLPKTNLEITPKILDLVWPELTTLSQIPTKLLPLLQPAVPPPSEEFKKTASVWLSNFSADFSEWQKKTQVGSGVKGKALFFPLRLALTGEEHGFEMRDLVSILGEKTIKERLERYVAS